MSQAKMDDKAFGVITNNKAESSYMNEWCEGRGWLPPHLGHPITYPFVVCVDYVEECAMWTSHLDRAMAYMTFEDFIYKHLPRRKACTKN